MAFAYQFFLASTMPEKAKSTKECDVLPDCIDAIAAALKIEERTIGGWYKVLPALRRATERRPLRPGARCRRLLFFHLFGWLRWSKQYQVPSRPSRRQTPTAAAVVHDRAFLPVVAWSVQSVRSVILYFDSQPLARVRFLIGKTVVLGGYGT